MNKDIRILQKNLVKAVKDLNHNGIGDLKPIIYL